MQTLAHLPRDWFARCRLKLRHVELLVALDGHRHLGRAAEAIGLPQPAASKLLGELEERLGQELFERQPRGLQPNAFGEVLIRRAQVILTELDGARDELSGLARGDAGRVAIGTIEAPTITLLPDMVEALQRRHPRLRLHLRPAASDVLMGELLDGALDMVLGRPVGDPPPEAINYREIGTEPLCVVCRPRHPLLSAPSVPLPALRDANWVLQPSGSVLRRSVNGAFRAAGLTPPERVVNTPSLLFMLAYVGRTDALGVMFEPAARQQAGFGQIALLPAPLALDVGPYGLILPRGRRLSPAARVVLDALDAVLDRPGWVPDAGAGA